MLLHGMVFGQARRQFAFFPLPLRTLGLMEASAWTNLRSSRNYH